MLEDTNMATATKEELQQRLANLEAKIAPLQSAADAASAKEKEAYAARDAAGEKYQVSSKLSTLIAAKKAAADDPTNPEKAAAVAQAQSDFKAAKEGYAPYVDAADAATKETIAVRGPLVDAETEAGQVEEQIQTIEKGEPAAAQAEADKNAAQAADPTSTIKTPESTNPSATDEETDAKNADPNNTPDDDTLRVPPGAEEDEDRSEDEDSDSGPKLLSDNGGGDEDAEADSTSRRGSLPAGAERSVGRVASAEWAGAKDLRAYLRVPRSYIIGPAAGPSGILGEFGGILFPYTPTISYDSQAVYGSVNPVHSNYTQYFYKNSQVGNISVTGKFTVQNEKEGAIWLGMIHLLRSLTKMRFGTDADAGAPPPVCRLEAYGDFMLRNVPVVVQSFKFDLPDNVDYIEVGKSGSGSMYKTTLVPSVSTISITLNVMYSRREMQEFSVDNWLSGKLKGQGYL